jgi:hypothetical protein
MGGGNVEQLWYGLCLFKATITLFVVSVAVLLCKRFARPIPWNSVIRRWTKYKERIWSAPCRLPGTLMLRSPDLPIAVPTKAGADTPKP